MIPIDGVVQLFPLPIGPPPVSVVYQKTPPDEQVAPSTTVPVLILEPGVELVIVGKAFTIIVMVFDVAGEAITQAAFEVITQVIISPFDKAEVANVVLLVKM